MVLADSRAAALEAAEAVIVEYSELPVVTDPMEAMAPGAPPVWDEYPDNIGYLWKRGDAAATEANLAAAAHVTKLEFSVSRVTANSMEPRGAWAEIGPDGRMVVHASNQSPFNLRNGMANGIFGIPPTDIRVIPGDVGGSFGMKSGVHVEVVLVAWAARKLNRPVRWISDRTEGFLTDEQAREMRIVAELGLDANNKITALKLRWNANLGAYCSGRSGWPVGNVGGIAGTYIIPAISAEVCGILTHTVPTAAYRGAGRPEATYAIERIIDVAARERGISPYELRRINLIPPEAMPYKTALTFLYDCGEFEGNMIKAAELAELDSFEQRRATSKAEGKLRGIGLTNCIEVAGGPFLRPAKDLSTLRFAEDGKLILRTGSMSVGQGLETTMCQIVSDRFGIPIENILYEQGDTDQLPFGKGNGGSGALCIGGGAVMLAADKVIERAKKLAAELLEASVTDIELRGGKVPHRRHRPLDRCRQCRPRLLRPELRSAGRRRRPDRKRGVQPDRRDVPERHAYLRGRNRPRYRRDRNRSLFRRRGTGQSAQSDDRRRPDPRRRRARHRPGDGRGHRARFRVRPDADSIVHGLPNAARRRSARLPPRDAGGADEGQPHRRQRCRRGRHGRRDGRRDERRQRRSGSARHPSFRYASVSGTRLGGDQRGARQVIRRRL